mgnify:CR=1 FL=1
MTLAHLKRPVQQDGDKAGVSLISKTAEEEVAGKGELVNILYVHCFTRSLEECEKEKKNSPKNKLKMIQTISVKYMINSMVV